MSRKCHACTFTDKFQFVDMFPFTQGYLKTSSLLQAGDGRHHALLTRKDIIEFANEKGLSAIRVPEDGECTVM